jgi:hypothetical protein
MMAVLKSTDFSAACRSGIPVGLNIVTQRKVLRSTIPRRRRRLLDWEFSLNDDDGFMILSSSFA